MSTVARLGIQPVPEGLAGTALRIDPPRFGPDKMLRHLLAEKGLKRSDLWPVIGSKSRVSEIIAGERSISKSQAKKLAAFFHVPVELFI